MRGGVGGGGGGGGGGESKRGVSGREGVGRPSGLLVVVRRAGAAGMGEASGRGREGSRWGGAGGSRGRGSAGAAWGSGSRVAWMGVDMVLGEGRRAGSRRRARRAGIFLLPKQREGARERYGGEGGEGGGRPVAGSRGPQRSFLAADSRGSIVGLWRLSALVRGGPSGGAAGRWLICFQTVPANARGEGEESLACAGAPGGLPGPPAGSGGGVAGATGGPKAEGTKGFVGLWGGGEGAGGARGGLVCDGVDHACPSRA